MSDLSKIFIGDGIKEVVINYQGEEHKFKVKEISWARKNEILSKSTKINKDGTTSFAVDRYNIDYLAEIIVEAPWGNQQAMKISLLRMNPEFGSLLAEKLIPSFSTEGNIEDGECLKKA